MIQLTLLYDTIDSFKPLFLSLSQRFLTILIDSVFQRSTLTFILFHSRISIISKQAII